jgi:hypothetical protein
MKFKIISGVLIVLILAGLISWNLPGCRRQRQAFKSNTVGLDRMITWTGDGVQPKTWKVRTKVFTDEPGKIRFFDEKGNIVVLMPGICVEANE